MKAKIKTITTLLIILNLLSFSPRLAYSQEEVTTTTESSTEETQSAEDTRVADAKTKEEEGAAANEALKQLNREIQAKKEEVSRLQEKQERYTRALKQAQSQKVSLSNQLAVLDNRLAKAELDIEVIETEIDVTDLEVRKINAEISKANEKIEKDKEHLSAILSLMHKQDRVNTLDIILLNNNLSEFLNQVKYLENINSEIGDSLDSLKEKKREAENKLADLDGKKKELEKLKNDLGNKKNILENDRGTKEFVLSQTKSSEKEYLKLVELARQEQAQAASDIANIEKKVRQKISEVPGKTLEFNDAGLIWPVPQNTITSTFHDPDYPFKYIFEHPAIDIRAGQGTTLKAAASGYVARAKNAGSGYSYIMIIHGNGLATVYGHVSKIYVAEDEYVVQGQAIGLSGGLPGTPGAGRLTTGAHLHFEVRLNGIPVDPLSYLP